MSPFTPSPPSTISTGCFQVLNGFGGEGMSPSLGMAAADGGTTSRSTSSNSKQLANELMAEIKFKNNCMPFCFILNDSRSIY